MSIYNIAILITSPYPEENRVFPTEVEAGSLTEAAEKSFDTFKLACRHVWKMPMEMLIKMEPRPNDAMSITAFYNDSIPIDEMDLFDAYFDIRVRDLQERMKGFMIPYLR